MAERARRIQDGSFLPRDEARAERQRRKAEQSEKWIWDWAKGDYILCEAVEVPITLVQAAMKFEKGLISEEEFDEFRRMLKEGPPKGKSGEVAQGASAAVAVGTATTEGAEAPPLKKYLQLSLRELKTALFHKKKDLARYKKDPDMPGETIEKYQKQIDEMEKQKIEMTPPDARLAQHDQIILDLKWEKEDGKVHLRSAEEHEAYWKKTAEELRKKDEEFEQKILDAEIAKSDFLKSDAGAKISSKRKPNKDINELMTKEAADVMRQRANDNTEESIKARECAAYLAEFVSKEALRKEEGEANGEASDSGEEESEDEEGFAISNRGMQDILDAAAKLPTQKQPDEMVAGVQRNVYTEEEKAVGIRMLKELQEQARQTVSTTTEGSSKITTPEKKKKTKVLSKTSSSSKPRLEKDKPVPAIRKEIELTVNAPGGEVKLD